ncbi:hypothetical protein QLX08_006975 [Tetragonisca angustula]|uniref:Uncharacterized protein n=1 Tax=Tetragonisca angustula TaxID=166442 RepID=A0AAW0ZS06_9HYME
MNNGETNQQNSSRHLFANRNEIKRDKVTHSEKNIAFLHGTRKWKIKGKRRDKNSRKTIIAGERSVVQTEQNLTTSIETKKRDSEVRKLNER